MAIWSWEFREEIECKIHKEILGLLEMLNILIVVVVI